MRQISAWMTSSLVLLFGIQPAFAIPVYLNIESRFPSGHYKRSALESRTKKIQAQNWFRVQTPDKTYGWLPENDVVTSLKLVSEAVLKESVPIRSQALLDAIEQELVAKGTRIQILSHNGSWVFGRFKIADATRESWINSESLSPVTDSPAEKIFVKPRTLVHALPGPNARVIRTITVPTIMHVIKERDDWFEVRVRESNGFIKKADAITARDLGENTVHALNDRAPLKTAPLPYSDLVSHLASGTPLKILSTQSLRWGQAKLSDVGEIWWPMHELAEEEKEPTIKEELTTSELFKRKLFDMASSPVIRSLKFASAQGIYRTTDGTKWTKIPYFHDKNFPIAISGAGVVFVGPYLSDDHGETFEQWIRWDKLVAALKRYPNLSAQKIQIHEIHPEDPAGKKVKLKLGIGEEFLVTVATHDQGQTWE